MKKILCVVLAMTMCCGMLTGCGENQKKQDKDGKVQEYTIDEFGKIYKEVETQFEDEAAKEYLTDEEKYSEKGYEIYKAIAKKKGLPSNKAITIRGEKKTGIYNSFKVVSSDGKYEVPCFPEKQKPNTSIFVEEGEKIVVSGVFSKDINSFSILSDARIDSLDTTEISYEDNIAKIVAELPDYNENLLIMGRINSVMTKEEFEKQLLAYKGLPMFNDVTIYADKVACLVSEDKSSTMYFAYSDGVCELKDGDRVAIRGNAEVLLQMLTADGSYKAMMGIIQLAEGCYVFQE